MHYINLIRAGVLGASCLALSACLGSSNGTTIGGGGGAGAGGGAGGKTPAEFDAKFDALSSNTSGLVATSTRLQGTATYSGVTRVSLSSTADSTQTGEAFADLAVQADFGNETIAGQATNFTGTLNGNPVTISGTLDSANAVAPSTLAVVETPLAGVPGVPAVPGVPTSIVATSFALNLGGTLSDDTGEIGTVLMGLGGPFVGPLGSNDPAAAYGPTTIVVGQPVGGTNPGISIGGGGTFYLERD